MKTRPTEVFIHRLLLLIPAVLQLSAMEPPVIRIVDWNIHKGKHLNQVASALRAENADLCLLQEVDQAAKRTHGIDIAAELARRLEMHYVFTPAFEELGQSDTSRLALHGQAILSKMPIRNVRVLRFKNQTHFWKPRAFLPNWGFMQRRLGGRVAQVAEIEKGGQRLIVYNLHLESRSRRVRAAQLEEVLADARRYPSTIPVLIGGDLNSVFQADKFRVRMEQAGFQSCFGGQRVRTHVVFGALDWIFIRGNQTCGAAAVIRGTHASDHDPVAATITLGSSRRNATRAGL
jgi:endonuclease/exonuclease/phosphatase family metal-dependent hydrolase